MRTFKLSEDQIELMHRVFGGEKIIEDQVETINTGGYVMHDLYPTENGHLVMVWEYGAGFLPDRETYDTEDYQDHMYHIEYHNPDKYPFFTWDEPLEYTDG